jgi:hypothetical protein
MNDMMFMPLEIGPISRLSLSLSEIPTSVVML